MFKDRRIAHLIFITMWGITSLSNYLDLFGQDPQSHSVSSKRHQTCPPTPPHQLPEPHGNLLLKLKGGGGGLQKQFVICYEIQLFQENK